MPQQMRVEDAAYSNILAYAKLHWSSYQLAKHHVLIGNKLMQLEKDDNFNRLCVFLPPRSGKCIDPDTPIVMADGSIKCAKDCRFGEKILAHQSGDHACMARIIAMEDAFKPSYQITTRTGRKIIASFDHPLLTFDGYKQVADLTEKDHLAVLNYNHPDDEKYRIPKDELDFITCMLFDGHCRKRSRTFSKSDKYVQNLFFKASKNLKINVTHPPSKPAYDFYVSTTCLPLLKKYNLYEKLSYQKRLPIQFFRMPIDQKYRFIELMIQTDGYFSNDSYAAITLSSEKLIDDIQHLLSLCNIATSKTYKHNPYHGAWILSIGRSQLKKLEGLCYFGNKHHCFIRIIEKRGLSIIEAFPAELLKGVKSVRSPRIEYRKDRNVGMAKLQSVARVYPEFEKYLHLDFFYDQVVNIEFVGNKSLIHLQTTGEHNFIANGFVSHNTMLVGNYFVTWFLGRNPEKEVIYTSYSHERSTDVGQRIKNIMLEPIYNQIFPDCEVRTDSKSAKRITTTANGNFYAVGVGGALTGRGCDLLIIDDVIKDNEQAKSDTYRNRIEEWFATTAYTRLHPGNKIVLIMTRWSYDDIGYYLTETKKHENWHIIELPSIAEEDHDVIGRQKGQALWPERYPIEELENIKETMGSEAFNALHQQRPAPKGGGMVKLEWFQRFDLANAPVFKKIVLSADTAQKETELHDPTAITVWGETETDYYLLYVYNRRWNYPKLKRNTIKIWEKWNNSHPASVPLLIEDKGSGTGLIQDLKSETTIPIIATPATKSKEIRMSEVTALIEAGRVFLPYKANWLYEAETQISRFPAWKHDDICDSMSHYLKWAGRPRYRKSRLTYYK